MKLSEGLRETEAGFQGRIVEYARLHHWMTYHTHDSRRSNPGFPDLVIARGPRLIFAELKSDRGRVTADQQRWIETLARIPGVNAHVWRPADWDQIVEVLA